MRSVVVGIDDSAASHRALDRALDEGASSGRPVLALHVHPPFVPLQGVPGYVYLEPAPRATALRDARHLLAAGLRRRTSEVPVSARADAAEGIAGRELVTAAAAAGLLVVGGRGRGALAGALLGSTTAFVLHHAPCPVMVVPAGGAGTASAARFRRVVVGLDGSASARSALLWGLHAARRASCPLVAVHCWQTPTALGRAPLGVATTLRDDLSSAGDRLGRELAEALPDDHGVDVRAELSHSTPARGCLQAATDEDLLVLGSRGRGGLASLVLGSVATHCSQHARGALVVVRAGQERLDDGPDVRTAPAQEVASAAPPRA